MSAHYHYVLTFSIISIYYIYSVLTSIPKRSSPCFGYSPGSNHTTPLRQVIDNVGFVVSIPDDAPCVGGPASYQASFWATRVCYVKTPRESVRTATATASAKRRLQTVAKKLHCFKISGSIETPRAHIPDEYTTAHSAARAMRNVARRLEERYGLAEGALYTGNLRAVPCNEDQPNDKKIP